MIQDVRDITSFKWATVTGTNPLAIRLDGDATPLALIPDSLMDPMEMWVGLRVRVELSLRKVVVHGSGTPGYEQSGDIKLTARPAAPNGWRLCDGSAISRSTYWRLFAAIGTTFGAGDGSTTFNVPDMRGRVAAGRDPGQTEFDTLGEAGGAKTHTLTNAQLPALVDNAGFGVTVQNRQNTAGPEGHYVRGAADAIGGGQAHNNLQPYMTLNYVIKL